MISHGHKDLIGVESSTRLCNGWLSQRHQAAKTAVVCWNHPAGHVWGVSQQQAMCGSSSLLDSCNGSAAHNHFQTVLFNGSLCPCPPLMLQNSLVLATHGCVLSSPKEFCTAILVHHCFRRLAEPTTVDDQVPHSPFAETNALLCVQVGW